MGKIDTKEFSHQWKVMPEGKYKRGGNSVILVNFTLKKSTLVDTVSRRENK